LIRPRLAGFEVTGDRKTIMKSHLLSLCLVAGASVFGAETQPLYLNSSQPLETRVEDLLSRLTLEEKNSLIHADSTFTTAAIPRLGIPLRWMDDGPNGVREDIAPDSWRPAGRTDDFSTAMPVGICLARHGIPILATAKAKPSGRKPASAARTSCSDRA
jgi:beta-glucosidase